MTIKPIGRRTVLCGLAGASVALPWLELMEHRRARAAKLDTTARFFVVAYGGISLGRYNEYVTPSAIGTGWPVTVGLRPLLGNSVADKLASQYDYPSVADEFSVISGLMMPWDGSGPASRGDSWHGCTMCPQLCGVSISGKDSPLQAPSSDWLVHRAIGGSKLHLKYRVQANSYTGEGDNSRGRLSAGLDDSGDLVHFDPVVSLEQAHHELFANVQPGNDSSFDQLAWERHHAERKSVLDLVRDSADRLRARLGTTDRQRLERHFDEIRALEQRILALKPPSDGGAACIQPTAPVDQEFGSEWSNETERAKVFGELTYFAFACDQATAVNFQLTYTSCYMTAELISGDSTDVHETGHSGSDSTNMGVIYAWHIEPLARLVDKLRSTPGPLGTLLDQTAIVFINEAGMADEDLGDHENTSHSSRNMMALVAGRAGGHQPGRHIAMNNAVHPSSAIVSAMRMVGCNDPLGELDTDIPELFT